MTATDRLLDVALLAVPEATASTLYGMYDLLCSAGRDWNLLVDGTPGKPRIRPTIVSTDGRGFHAANGAWVEPQRALAPEPVPDVICVLEVFVAPGTCLAGRYSAEYEWLRRCYRSGATLATACTGTLLLAEAGLLDGLDATTHWGYCEALARGYPKVRVHPERALVITGEGQRIIMGGGGTSWLDVGLFLVARFLGVEEAMRLGRLYLVDWHDVGQQPFAALTRSRQVGDALIAKCQVWVAQHYDQNNPVAGMARLSGLAARTFARRFTRATGMSPMEYVQTLRLEEAKHLLEASDEPIEAVANLVGYEDASFFGRLFRRKVGLTAAQYRRRFQAMRRRLEVGAVRSPTPTLSGAAGEH